MNDTEHLDHELFGPGSPCFGCAPHHPTGFRLRFAREGEGDAARVVTRMTPGEAYQGPPGIMHGGLVGTLADELAAWTVIGLRARMGFTASYEGRLLKPVRIGREVVGTGRIARETPRVLDLEVVLEQGELTCFRGTFTFVLLDKAGAERLLGALPPEWERFCR